MFKVYERVWVMKNNAPTEKIIYSVTEQMNNMKNGTEKRYTLVNSQVGAGVGDNKEQGYATSYIYKTKESLIASL